MPSNKVGIADIAKALSISTMSVSRALSGKEGISESLRDRIHQTAREMGYFKSKTDSMPSILVLHQKPYIQDNSNYSTMIQGMESALQQINAEYSIEFVDKDKQDGLQLPCKLSKEQRYDGVIFIGSFNESYADFIHKRIKNLVFYAAYTPSIDHDSVWANFNNNAFKQCEYLIHKGHKNIGFISNLDFFRNRERLLGITSALEKHGLPVRTDLFLNSEDDLDKHVLALLQNAESINTPDSDSAKQPATSAISDTIGNSSDKPTAFICQWDYTAVKLVKFLHENGISVPGDVSIIGSGNTEMSTLCQPSLTTLDLHLAYSCEVAVALLLRRIANEDKPSENIGINGTLVERDSVRSL